MCTVAVLTTPVLPRPPRMAAEQKAQNTHTQTMPRAWRPERTQGPHRAPLSSLLRATPAARAGAREHADHTTRHRGEATFFFRQNLSGPSIWRRRAPLPPKRRPVSPQHATRAPQLVGGMTMYVFSSATTQCVSHTYSTYQWCLRGSSGTRGQQWRYCNCGVCVCACVRVCGDVGSEQSYAVLYQSRIAGHRCVGCGPQHRFSCASV